MTVRGNYYTLRPVGIILTLLTHKEGLRGSKKIPTGLNYIYHVVKPQEGTMKRENQIIEDYRKSDAFKKENFWFMYRELRPAFDEMDEAYPFGGNIAVSKKRTDSMAFYHIL